MTDTAALVNEFLIFGYVWTHRLIEGLISTPKALADSSPSKSTSSRKSVGKGSFAWADSTDLKLEPLLLTTTGDSQLEHGFHFFQMLQYPPPKKKKTRPHQSEKHMRARDSISIFEWKWYGFNLAYCCLAQAILEFYVSWCILVFLQGRLSGWCIWMDYLFYYGGPALMEIICITIETI